MESNSRSRQGAHATQAECPLLFICLWLKACAKQTESSQTKPKQIKPSQTKANQTELEDAPSHHGFAGAHFTRTSRAASSKATTHTNVYTPEKASAN